MVKKVIVIGIVLFCIMLLILFAVPATAILGESLFVRWDIDNPYVNHNFDEWNCAYVEGFHAFLIPKEWALQKNDNVYWITNDLGEVWAFGTAFGTEEDCFDNYCDELKEKGYADMIYQKTGLVLDAYFSATPLGIMKLLDHF